MAENRNLLIVDDEPEALAGYKEFLAPDDGGGERRSSRRQAGASSHGPKEKYNLFLAASGREAVEIFKRELAAGNEIAAGFFDVKLGGEMDGLATIQAIKALSPDVHCVVVTAYHDRTVDEIHTLFGEEFKDQWDYLNKPFTQGEIVQKARQMVAAWNRKRQLEAVQQQLIRSERLSAIGQVARGVGHEFGNILLRIIGKIDLALMGTAEDKTKEHLDVAMKACERAGVIVKNLQTFSKGGGIKTDVSFSSPIQDALTLMGHELMKGGVKVDSDLQETPPLSLDPVAIGQVFLNLFINAMHAMPEGGSLKVSVRAEGKDAVATVTDSGTGIKPEVLPRIFEHAFSTKGDKGSGLGLSISKQIIESHGGTIGVESTLGKGTLFTIRVPLKSGG